ncbi:hypothetical protein [Porphyromonas canoris]|uniref:Uncharacterized protein n=1 Tax=Porphyromonas canoris TaxID=36875 RepID=A0ABR4XLK4_9PORP|nr:hypothetical protein [Porphyromonas canoris]KGN92609.1 hypothetical protein HQ43_05080 [Porphyromonas canoris]
MRTIDAISKRRTSVRQDSGTEPKQGTAISAPTLQPISTAPAILPKVESDVVVKAPSTKMSYQDAIDILNQNHEKKEEEIAKREGRNMLLASIGDGISALSNLFFASKGAYSTYDPRNSLSGALQQRYDKLKAERDRNRDAYINYSLRARHFDDQRADQDRRYNLATQREKRDAQEQDERMKRDRENQINRAALDYYKINAAKSDAGRKEVEAAYQKDLSQSQIDRNRAAASSSRASATNSLASAEKHKKGKTISIPIDGEIVDIEAGRINSATIGKGFADLGLSDEREVRSTRENPYQGKTTTVSRRKLTDDEKLVHIINEANNGNERAREFVYKLAGKTKPKATWRW